MAKKTIVIIPTYNERENIKELINKILKLNINNIEILVVDDYSPDGTWKIVKDISKKDKEVHLLLRKINKGRGNAGKAGFIQALKMKADYIIEMDADFSHDPKYIPIMLDKIKSYDVILGSRLIEGSEDEKRGILRRSITKFSNAYVRFMLGFNIKDINSGYRCFRKKVIKDIVYSFKSHGPDIVQESLYKIYLKGYKIKEVPIRFEQRAKGKSKLGLKQIITGFIVVLKLKLRMIK